LTPQSRAFWEKRQRKDALLLRELFGVFRDDSLGIFHGMCFTFSRHVETLMKKTSASNSAQRI
jgi:hypothetical protein